MTRNEHLAWAKDRALAELDGGGGLPAAMASIQSDLRKHPDLRDHSGLELMAMLAFGGHLSSAREVREFIGGFQ